MGNMYFYYQHLDYRYRVYDQEDMLVNGEKLNSNKQIQKI